MVDLALPQEESQMKKTVNIALSNTQVSEVIGVIFLGVVAVLLLVALRKSNTRYEELVSRLVAMKE